MGQDWPEGSGRVSNAARQRAALAGRRCTSPNRMKGAEASRVESMALSAKDVSEGRSL